MKNFIKGFADWLIWLGDWLFEIDYNHAWEPYIDIGTGVGFIFLICAFIFLLAITFVKKLRDIFF